VVLAIVATLMTIAVPRYFDSLEKSKEAALIENLRVLRETIDKFYADSGRYPEKLEDLVDRRYLRAVPIDPITESVSTWRLLPPPDTDKGRIFDVKSGAPGQTRRGKAYSEL
jgi:general secretion pathway protein G